MGSKQGMYSKHVHKNQHYKNLGSNLVYKKQASYKQPTPRVILEAPRATLSVISDSSNATSSNSPKMADKEYQTEPEFVHEEENADIHDDVAADYPPEDVPIEASEEHPAPSEHQDYTTCEADQCEDAGAVDVAVACEDNSCGIEVTGCDTGCGAVEEPEQTCGPAINEVCTPKWDYVTKQQVLYRTVPYQTQVKGCKTVMVDKVVPDCKYVMKTKQVPCTVKKMVKSQEPYTKTIMKPVQVPTCKIVTKKFTVPCTKTVQYTKQVPDTKCVDKQFKVPTTKTVMKSFPVQTTKCVKKMVTVDSTKQVQEQVKVPCTKTIKVPQTVCETKYVTQYKTVSFKKPYEARIYKETCKLPCMPEPTCQDSCAPVATSCEMPCQTACQTACGAYDSHSTSHHTSSSASVCGAC